MIKVGTWVRLPDGTADFVWESIGNGRVLVSRNSREFHVAELRALTSEEVAQAQSDSNARFPQTPLAAAANVQPVQELLAQRVQLARDLLVAGRARTVEAAFDLADSFAEEVQRRMPRKEGP